MDHQPATPSEASTQSEIHLSLTARPERRLIRPGGSSRHIDFVIRVGKPASGSPRRRIPLRIAIVLDRSGSMAGEKLATAKQAALAVVDHLDERDRVALVVFDDRVDVVQPLSKVTPELKSTLQSALAGIDARATTALHEGWLTGAHQVASDDAEDANEQLARVLLLTDGLANVGEQDPERIAAQAAGVREQAGVGTSTFGIGADYNESLLGPMAVAGGGQFHHLRSPSDIAATFVGELGDLLAVAASQVYLELRLDRRVQVDVISAFRLGTSDDGAQRHHRISIGDLLPGDERHVVVRFTFPISAPHAGYTIQARLRWRADGVEHATRWEEARFECADDRACDAEPRDAQVMHWVGLHHAERARQQAAECSRRGDLDGAREVLRQVSARIAEYAGEDADLQRTIRELDDLQRELSRAPVDPLRAKELTYQAHRTSRGQKDYRPAPPALPVTPVEVISRYLRVSATWPAPVLPNASHDLLRDRYRGALLGGAVGNALGRTTSGLDPSSIRTRFGASGLRTYPPRLSDYTGPRGLMTVDTQLTLELARSLAAVGRFDPDDFAQRLIAARPSLRGGGRGIRGGIDALASGTPWWQSGLRECSMGDGAAMRAAPVGLAFALDRQLSSLVEAAVVSAFITHTHPVGIGGAVVVAAGVARCIREALRGTDRLDRQSFLSFVASTIDGTEPQPTVERRPGGRAVRLVERIREVVDLLNLASPDEAFAVTGNGASALEAVPAALYAFLRSPDDPREVILTAVNAGHDADTVAGMAGNFAGAWCGAERLEREAPEWLDELEARDELVAIADYLADLARSRC